jgi:hypothetical protein
MRHDAGVVEDHVDTAVLVDGTVHERLDLGRIGYVCDERGCLSSSLRELIDQRLQSVGAPRSQHDSRAALSQVARRCFTQTTAGPGNDDDLARDVRIGVH